MALALHRLHYITQVARVRDSNCYMYIYIKRGVLKSRRVCTVNCSLPRGAAAGRLYGDVCARMFDLLLLYEQDFFVICPLSLHFPLGSRGMCATSRYKHLGYNTSEGDDLTCFSFWLSRDLRGRLESRRALIFFLLLLLLSCLLSFVYSLVCARWFRATPRVYVPVVHFETTVVPDNCYSFSTKWV